MAHPRMPPPPFPSSVVEPPPHNLVVAAAAAATVRFTNRCAPTLPIPSRLGLAASRAQAPPSQLVAQAVALPPTFELPRSSRCLVLVTLICLLLLLATQLVPPPHLFFFSQSPLALTDPLPTPPPIIPLGVSRGFVGGTHVGFSAPHPFPGVGNHDVCQFLSPHHVHASPGSASCFLFLDLMANVSANDDMLNPR